MTPLDDDLLNELRAARPVLTPEPVAMSAEAQAMRDRILAGGVTAGPGRAGRAGRTGALRPRRRLLIPAAVTTGLAAAAAVTVTAGLALAPGTAHPPAAARPAAPATQALRTAVLDALQRASGSIAYSSQTWSVPGQPTSTLQTWTYPAAPAPGQLTRYRQFIRQGGAPFQDVEYIYPAGRPSIAILPPHPVPRQVPGRLIDVEYSARTWSDQARTPVTAVPGFGPAQIRQLIAAGHYRVLGRVRLDGRPAIEFGWSDGPGPPARLWVDTRTYLPLKSEFRSGTGGLVTTTYGMLPATAANVALLRPPIPAGFRRTAHPPTHPHG